MIETPQTLPHPADEATAMLLAMAHEGARATERVAMAPDGARAIERVAMSHDGARVLVDDDELVRFADGRVLMRSVRARALALVEGEAWVVVEDGAEHTLHRFDAAGDPLEPVLQLGRLGANLRITATRVGVRSALIEGDRAVFVREQVVEELGARGRDRRVLIGGRGVAERSGGALVFRRTGTIALPSDLAAAVVVSGAMVFDGSAALIELERTSHRTAVVVDPRRGVVHTRIRLGEAAILAVAERKGLVVLGRGAHVALFDLRAGRCVGERILPAPVRACAIDADGTRLIVLDAIGTLHTLAAAMANWAAPVTASSDTEPERSGPETAPDRDEDGNAASRDGIELHRSEPPDDGVGERSEATGHAERESSDGAAQRDKLSSTAEHDRAPSSQAHHTAVTMAHGALAYSLHDPDSAWFDGPATWLSAHGRHDHRPSGPAPLESGDTQGGSAVDPADVTNGEAELCVDAAPELPVHAVPASVLPVHAAPPLAPSAATDVPTSPAVEDDVLPMIATRRLLALARPHDHEPLGPGDLADFLDDARAWVTAVCHTALAIAEASTDEVVRARALERDAFDGFARWHQTSAPHVELAVELGLSASASVLLVLSAAPRIWGELAVLYAQVAGDRERGVVDESLLATLVEADAVTRVTIARELDPDAPLIRSGAIELTRGIRPHAALTVHPRIVRRLAGDRSGARAWPTRIRALPQLFGPRAAIAELARKLETATVDPVRVVVRGRAGSGRRSLAAALAALADRRLGLVNVAIDHADTADAELCRRLRDVALAGDLPCVSLDELPDEASLRGRLRRVLNEHPGALFIRAPASGELPLAPGYYLLTLPPLTETERCAVWRHALDAHGLSASPDALAARFAVGPGVIERVCEAIARDTPDASDAGPALAAAVRQHRSARIASIATRVDELAAWDELVVSDEVGDVLRELVARVCYRRTVLERWGMNRVASTAQGVTALFQGGPGTGKTMAAGVVARALGYELWRVDLSKVVSKWVGETEKNLAAVFDAAEDGEVVLLFDEADSLFGKRTEVKSSHDRNANQEVNYLLQRLDAFSGIAILTTNFGTTIDAAFRRRVSAHVRFEFPDETERERLWRIHLPATLPQAGDLDLAALAHRYPLSGGYIRNAALRAAYLAAGAGRAVDGEIIVRAVRAEYHGQARVSDAGRLD